MNDVQSDRYVRISLLNKNQPTTYTKKKYIKKTEGFLQENITQTMKFGASVIHLNYVTYNFFTVYWLYIIIEWNLRRPVHCQIKLLHTTPNCLNNGSMCVSPTKLASPRNDCNSVS